MNVAGDMPVLICTLLYNKNARVGAHSDLHVPEWIHEKNYWCQKTHFFVSSFYS
jgi:hypothetical protein